MSVSHPETQYCWRTALSFGMTYVAFCFSAKYKNIFAVINAKNIYRL